MYFVPHENTNLHSFKTVNVPSHEAMFTQDTESELWSKPRLNKLLRAHIRKSVALSLWSKHLLTVCMFYHKDILLNMSIEYNYSMLM